jgi:hypothetical protein
MNYFYYILTIKTYKMKTCNLLRSVFFIICAVIIVQGFGQQMGIADARSVLGANYLPPQGQYDPGANRTSCQYFFDDGTQENSVGFVGASYDGMWLNYFTVTPGCEQITTAYVMWGLMPDGGPCRIILYEDPDDDGNPDDAVYLTESLTTVQNANTNIFTIVSITPTTVSGGFFIAALCQNLPSATYPAPLDEGSSLGDSWFAGHFVAGAFDVFNLMNNAFTPIPAGTYFPGNWCLRAEGIAAGPVDIPISNWALFIGIGLILVVAVVRFRRFI